MSHGFIFEISVLKNTLDYNLGSDPERIKQISENLEKDPLWGWCEPRVTVHFDKFTAVAGMAYGSFTSEEDFKSSPNYEYLKDVAVDNLRAHLDFAVEVLARKTEIYHQSKNQAMTESNEVA
jgi:hypothetical protein